ncbi:5-carboxymethyl-2-hydroxymuconate Delta-isomerase [Burkholderia contaminans]|uniref:5-carboxymethyl-2-hydroxymuconate Delta-isomerase n=1 Tax=Burkholderia contaminans TaxID=488447 RepID=UPI003D665D00
MPHLIIESTPHIARVLDFRSLTGLLHEQLAAQGHALLAELKSRVYTADQFLSGDDPTHEFIVVRLLLTKPRSEPVLHDMGRLIHDVVRDAVERGEPAFGWQCCVLVCDFSGAPYIKTVRDGTRSDTGAPA